MKQSATLISWVCRRMFPRCKSNVRNFLTMLFLLSGMLFVTQKSDAQCNSFGISFTQGANRDNFESYTTGELHWINSILQSSNSRYIEGMSTMQRIVFDNLPSCGSCNHILRIKLEARKGDVHAYDFITSWDNALKAAAAIAPGFGLMPANRADPKLHECDAGIGSCSETACNLVTNGGIGTGSGADFRDLPIIFSDFANPIGPGESNLLIDDGTAVDQNSTRQVIQTYECRYGDNLTIPAGQTYAGTYDRTVRVYTEDGFLGANGDANNAVLFVGYGDANPNDGGDTYIYYDIMWSSCSPSVVIEFAAHIAVGVDGLANINPDNCNVTPLGVGYLLNRGASSISGGPYHVIIEDFQDAPGNTPNCEPNLGNQDNQLQGSEILLIPACTLQGPSAVCANATATYTATVTNPDNATNANNSTFLWEIINSSQSPPPASIIGAASGNVPQVPAGETSVPLSITVNTGGIGSYTVKLTITNGAATTTTDDDISSSCTVSTTVTGGPTIDCPDDITANPCQTQAQINTAYQNWLLTVTPSGATHNGGSVGPDKCGGTKTVIFTATNTCGSATCSATFTVTADATPPAFTGSYADVVLGCNPADPTGSLGSASATDNCGATTITSVDGAISSDGCNRARTRTFTATDGCNNTATTSRTVRWIADLTPPGFTGSYADVVLGCNPENPDGSLGTASANDACGPVTISQSDGAVVSDGCNRSRTRTFTARDGCNNTATASRTVRWISDLTPPVFTGSYADVVLACNPENPDGSLGTASATDACGPVTISQSDGAVVSDGCNRSRTRTFTARDGCNNTATISRTVRWIFDNTPPVFTGNYDPVALGCNPGGITFGGATASDGCGGVTITSTDGDVQSSGCSRTATRTFTARDACGNTATITRVITFIADLTPPVFSGSYADVNLGCNPANPAGSLGGATASDACGPVTISQSDGAVASDGCNRSQTRTFTARDGCNNTSSVSRTVRWIADLTPPVFSGSYDDVSLGCNPANPDASLGTASASDACGPVTISQSDGAVASDGCNRSRTRTFTARDGCNNTATVSRTVRWISDLTPPAFTGSYADVNLGCNPANPDASLGTASATDACGAVTISSSDGAVASDGCNRSRTRTFTARDGCNNTATVSRTVRWISDLTPPVFSGSYDDVSLGCNPANPDASLGTASASDACGPVTISQSDGAVASDGCNRSRTRTFTARDGCNNTSSVSRTVRWIADVTPPVFSGSYADVNLGCNPANPAGSLGGATASDACGPVTISQSDGSVLSVGCNRSQTRTFTARDGCNNTSSVSRTVRWVADLTGPVFNCPANYTAECGVVPVFGDPTASDACGGVTISQLGTDVATGECPTLHTRTWRAIDACGNTSTCSQTVTVPCCAANCTYTQGAYGTAGGKMCDGTNGGYSTEDFIELILGNLGGSLTVGCAGHSVTVSAGDADCVIDKLPGGGSSGAIPAGDHNLCTLPGSMLKGGRINNALLAQTITLGLNLGIDPGTLSTFALQPNQWLVTADLEECGSTDVKECTFNCVPDPVNIGQYIWTVATTPYHVSDCKITQAVYDALTTKNVSGLYALANSALCGNALPAGVTYSDITNAVDCINNAFDGCRAFTAWVAGDRPTAQSFCTLPSSTTPCPVLITRMGSQLSAQAVPETGLNVSAYPNPFRDRVNFVINSNVTGQATLEVYNMLGQKIQTVYKGHVMANRAQTVEYNVSSKNLNGGLIYILKQGGKQVTGKLLNLE